MLAAVIKLITVSTLDIGVFKALTIFQLKPRWVLLAKDSTSIPGARWSLKKFVFGLYKNIVTSLEHINPLAMLTICRWAPPDPRLSITINIFRRSLHLLSFRIHLRNIG